MPSKIQSTSDTLKGNYSRENAMKEKKIQKSLFLKHKHDEIRLTFRSAAITFPGTTEILVQTDELWLLPECW